MFNARNYFFFCQKSQPACVKLFLVVFPLVCYGYSSESPWDFSGREIVSIQEIDRRAKADPPKPKLEQFYKTFVKKDLRVLIFTSSFEVPIVPEEVIYISCILNNPYKEKKTGKIKIHYPKTWTPISKKEKIYRLGGTSSSPQVFAFKIPKNTKPGKYPIKFQVSGGLSDAATLHGRVAPFVHLQGELSAVKSSYNHTDTIKTTALLENQGNVDLRLKLRTLTIPQASLEYPKGIIKIKAQEKKKLSFKVFPLPLSHRYNQYVLFELIDEATDKVVWMRHFSTQITPSAMAQDRKYESIPSYLETTALMNNSYPVMIMELAGKGLIDPFNQHSLEFFFRVPSNINRYIYSSYQRLFLDFSHPYYEIKLGDANYTLTPLTQSRYGRGAGLYISPRFLHMGAQYTENPYHQGDNPQEIAGYVDLKPVESFSLSGNYLKKIVKSATVSEIVSGKTQFQLGSNTTVIEFAKNTRIDGKVRSSGALYLQTRGKWKKDAWYSLTSMYAGPLFFGYYQNSKILGATTSLPLGKRLRGDLGFNYNKQNFSAPFLYAISPYTIQRQYSANLSYNIFNGSYLFAKAWSVRGISTRNTPYDFLQNWGSLQAHLSFGTLRSSMGADFGKQTNYLLDFSSDLLKKFHISLEKTWNDWQMQAFYQLGNNNYFDSSNWNIVYGASLGIKYGARNDCGLTARRSRNNKNYVDTASLSVHWRHEFSNNHYIQLRYDQYIPFNNAPNSSYFSLTYKVPFGIPVAKRKDVGKVRGKVVDIWNQRPIAGALVELKNKRVYSDEAGEFYFPMIPVGDHDFKVNIFSQDLVETQKKNDKIAVHSNQESYVEVAAVPYCCLEGSISTYHYEETTETFKKLLEGESIEPVEKCKQSGIEVFIEHAESKEVFKVTSDSSGQFKFKRLKPGLWHVYVSDRNLPEYTYLDEQEMDIEIKPEESKMLSIKIYPIKFTPLDSSSF